MGVMLFYPAKWGKTASAEFQISPSSRISKPVRAIATKFFHGGEKSGVAPYGVAFRAKTADFYRLPP